LIFRRIAAAYLALFVLTYAGPIRSDASAQELEASLPLDPAIRSGTLPNGLTWFARRNTRPANRAALRLAVKAGSIDEDDDQRGLAHVLEHMAFNGTTHFKPGELVSYLESIGARFGPHVNAYTSYDETVYMLDVPTDREGLLDRGFVALSDFAGAMTLDPKEIDRERGVVIEEWRGRQGAGARMQVVHGKALYGASKYAERLPIGTPEVLKSFTPQRLRDFYTKWYRADRMAVVVVGDIDPAAAEQLIAKHFGGLPKPAQAAERPVHQIPSDDSARFGIASDPEAQQSSVAVLHKHPFDPMRTVADYRRGLVRSLIHQMLNARFGELARQADAPFLGASSDDDRLGRTVETFTLGARVTEGAVANGLEALAREAARVEQHGFGEAELDRARKWTLASYEQAFNEREKSESAPLAMELVRHFLEAEPAPGIAYENAVAKKYIPTITARETAALAKELISTTERVVLVTSPEKAGVTSPTEEALRAALDRGAKAEVTAWRDDMAGRDLLAKKPQPGRVTSTRAIPEIGITVLTLSNGASVWLKPTDFKNDQVLFTAYAKGGTSLASPSEYYAAVLSPTLVSIAGIGGFTPVELDKLLPGRLVDVSPYVSSYTHGVSGSSTPRDLETAFQLLHLYFTAPNRSPEAFDLMKRRLHAVLANQAQSPGAVFGERLRQVNTNNHYTARSIRPEDVEKLTAETMWSYYDARFSNAADFTFFVVGAFDIPAITPLVTSYIGSLPSKGTPSTRVGDVRLEFPHEVRRETVRKGKEPKSQTVMSFFADTGLDELEMHRARAASSVLELRLRDQLREALGGTYSVGVDYSNTQPQPGYGMMSVEFGSAPENVDKLVQVVLDETARLRTSGPTDQEVKNIQEMERRDLETSMRQNAYWLNSLQTVHLLGWNPLRIAARMERAASLTRENMHAAFKKYFPANRYTVVTLLPETTSPH
jgi:zinc protease